jgi:isovaleryl-CoA dehydrogenase
MHISWTPEQEARRARFCRFGAEIIAPGSAQRDRDGSFDLSLWKALAAEGFWGSHVPRADGGDGGSLWDFLAGLEGLAKGADDAGFILSAVAHAGLVQVLLDYGTPEQKARAIPGLLTGALGATAATESTGGSHLSSVRTRAGRITDDRWQLTGTKSHITNAPAADCFLIVGRLDGIGDRDITLFLVERDRAGVSTGTAEDLLGQRTSPTGTIHLDHVEVGPADVVGPPGRGLRTLHTFLALDRLMYGIGVASALEAVLPRTVQHVLQRKAFGTELGNHEFIQDKIVTIRATIESARYLSYAAADALIRRDPTYSGLASCAKLAASEGAVQATIELIQIFGHLGYSRAFGIERYLRDAVAIRIAGGTTEMQKKNIYNDVVNRYAA